MSGKSGRPKLEEGGKTKLVAFRLTEEQAEFLKTVDNKSELIRGLLDAYIFEEKGE